MGNQDMAQMLASMGTSMGNTLAKSLKPIAEAQTKAMVDKKIFSTEGKQYDASELAKIKVWSNVDTLTETQPIWRECQQTKNVDTHRQSLWTRMLLWSATYGYEIDKSVYFERQLWRT